MVAYTRLYIMNTVNIPGEMGKGSWNFSSDEELLAGMASWRGSVNFLKFSPVDRQKLMGG